jgi:hypothetical protein
VDADVATDLGATGVPTSSQVDGVRQAARWLLAGTVVLVVGFFTTTTLRVTWPSLVVSLVQPILFLNFVWRLDAIMPNRKSLRGRLVSGLGFGGALVLAAEGFAALLVSPMIELINAGLILVGTWLIGFAGSGPPLPAPLPRRAWVGGLGWVLLATLLPIARMTGSVEIVLAVGLVALVCAVSVLGFVFGLIDLDRSPNVARP